LPGPAHGPPRPTSAPIIATVAEHTDLLDLPQLVQAVDANDDGEREAPDRDADEAEMRFLDEVLEVHAVEGGYEGAGTHAEGPDGEFEVEEHEGVAICVEDGANAVGRGGLALRGEKEWWHNRRAQ